MTVTEQENAPGTGLFLSVFLVIFLMSSGNLEKKADKCVYKNLSGGEEETETQACLQSMQGCAEKLGWPQLYHS